MVCHWLRCVVSSPLETGTILSAPAISEHACVFCSVGNVGFTACLSHAFASSQLHKCTPQMCVSVWLHVLQYRVTSPVHKQRVYRSNSVKIPTTPLPVEQPCCLYEAFTAKHKANTRQVNRQYELDVFVVDYIGNMVPFGMRPERVE